MSFLDKISMNMSAYAGTIGGGNQPPRQSTVSQGEDNSIGKLLATGNVGENTATGVGNNTGSQGGDLGLVERLSRIDASMLKPNHQSDTTARYLDLDA